MSTATEYLTSNNIREIPLADITLGTYRLRRVCPTVDDSHVHRLAKSIQEQGLLQPIVVVQANGQYELVAGEHRYTACKFLGHPTILATVYGDAASALIAAFAENGVRKQFDLLEECRALKIILDQTHCTQAELADKIGMSQPYVANKTRLLSLPENLFEPSRKLTEGHLVALLHVRSVLEDRAQGSPRSEEQPRQAVMDVCKTLGVFDTSVPLTVQSLRDKVTEWDGDRKSRRQRLHEEEAHREELREADRKRLAQQQEQQKDNTPICGYCHALWGKDPHCHACSGDNYQAGTNGVTPEWSDTFPSQVKFGDVLFCMKGKTVPHLTTVCKVTPMRIQVSGDGSPEGVHGNDGFPVNTLKCWDLTAIRIATEDDKQQVAEYEGEPTEPAAKSAAQSARLNKLVAEIEAPVSPNKAHLKSLATVLDLLKRAEVELSKVKNVESIEEYGALVLTHQAGLVLTAVEGNITKGTKNLNRHLAEVKVRNLKSDPAEWYLGSWTSQYTRDDIPCCGRDSQDMLKHFKRFVAQKGWLCTGGYNFVKVGQTKSGMRLKKSANKENDAAIIVALDNIE